MHTYGVMVNLTPEQQQEARERLVEFLSERTTARWKVLGFCEASAFTGRGVLAPQCNCKGLGWVSKITPRWRGRLSSAASVGRGCRVTVRAI